MNRIMQACLFAGSTLLSGSALGAACGGFPDVDDSVYAGDFCTGVDWLKNRNVTLGCGGGNYCPDVSVTRIQMAAFMNRLGKALESTFLYGEQTVGSGTPLASLPNVSAYCVRQFAIPPTGAGSYPRSATLSGWVLLHPSAAAHVIGAGAVYSIDGGGTWLGVGGGDYFAAAPTSAVEFRSIPVVSASQALDVGQTALFGIGIAIVQGAGTTMAPVDCAVSLRIENRNAVPPATCDGSPTIGGCNDSRDASLVRGPAARPRTLADNLEGN